MAIINGKQGNIQTVLVVGDNRLADNVIQSLSHGRWDIHQVTHSQSNLETNSRTIVHKLDSSHEALVSLLHDLQPDVIFSTQSAGSFEYQKQLIDSAIQTNVPSFVLAEFSQDCLNERIQERLPPYNERSKVVGYLRSQEGCISWTGIATGSPLEHALSSGNIGFDLKWQSATIHGTGEERFAASSNEWIGRVARAVLEHWHQVQNQYLYAAGMIISANQMLETLQKTTKQQWETGNMEVEEVVREAERRFERGFPDAGMFLIERTVLFDESLEAVRPFVEQDAKKLLGLKGEKLDDIIQKVLHEMEHQEKGGCGCD